MTEKKLPNIEVEENAYSEISKPDWKSVCHTHNKEDWFKYVGYIDNKDGTISCPKCNWGTRLPGYMRVSNGKIIDLRG
jgi:hypothetical protein